MIKKKRLLGILVTVLLLSGCGNVDKSIEIAPVTPSVHENEIIDHLTEIPLFKEESVVYNPPELRSDLYVAEMEYTEGIVIQCEEVPMREIPVNDATEFVKKLGVGWNLGNTLDAYKPDAEIVGAGLATENAWVGVSTTQEMIDAIKSAGFNTIRIPISWHNHLDSNLVIKERWFTRVQEIVDYAIADGMYVIINIHHDNEPNSLYGFYPDDARRQKSINYVKAIWSQVAERFANYDEHLIFESLNEPRLIGTSNEWYIDGSDKCLEAIDIINEMNQAFVDAVRAGDGYNKTRFLTVPGYDASVDGALHENFVLPTDSIENHLFVTTHAYSPYNFALQDGGISVFGDQEKAFIDGMFDSLYEKFVKNGIPVLMDEFGARDKDNLQDRVNYTSYYISVAKSVGIPCYWWDNNNFTGDGERFGILARRSLIIKYPEIVEAMVSQYKE